MNNRDFLVELAKQTMKEKNLQPDFPSEELVQVSHIKSPDSLKSRYEDLRSLLWCSIDNDDSRDLDQLTYAEKKANGNYTVWVAIADVDALVKKDSPVDIHARINTTSVYTPAIIFSMLPEKLSTYLTSLNENEDRVAIVVKMQINQKGDIETFSLFQAMVHNHAKLTYRAIGGWLEQISPIPEKVKKIPGLEDALNIQHTVAQNLRQNRYRNGSLTLESSQAEVRFASDQDISIQLSSHNFAHQLIEEFMIAANRSIAQYLSEAKIPSLRRVVRIPKYWDQIVELAKTYGTQLPKNPNSKALDAFLVSRQIADPDSFPDLSLAVIKLLGRGEYIVQSTQEHSTGHFALGIPNYAHCTAPNRRFPDLIAQRQYKALLQGEKMPYGLEELQRLAAHCTEQEDGAMKVERRVNKSAAAMVLSSFIGTVFQGIITGAGEKGTWVRLFKPSVEGKIVRGFENLKVGDKVTVTLKHVDVRRGFIDFER